MKTLTKLLITLLLSFFYVSNIHSQEISQDYKPLKNDSLRIGIGDKDFLPFIQSGYTLMLPKNKTLEGVLIFFEDSKYDQKNRSAKQMYDLASQKDFAVLSVSTEIPLDFYFSNASILSAHKTIKEVFEKYDLPNKNIFFLGASLVGHRAMQYIQFIEKTKPEFQLNTKGIVICNFTLDWTRKWHQHKRDIRINQINLWEAKLMNYMLETHLKGTPKTVPNRYHEFSPYSYFDEENRNIATYKNYAVRAYAEPAIKYRLEKYIRTLYENNTTDIVGFLAELKLAGNQNTELIVVQPKPSQKKKNAQSTWNDIDKKELMDWILKQAKEKD